MSNKAIAQALQIREARVKLLLRNLSKKLDALSRTEIAIKIMERDLLHGN